MSELKDMNVGIEDFQKIIQSNPSYYVDKTSFIKKISKENVALFTRPRRFGKTLTMSMLKYFYEMNYDNPSDISATVELFKDLDISKDAEFCKQHMGQYPVIFLTLKEVKGDNFRIAISKFAKLIYKEWGRFYNFINNNSEINGNLKIQIEDCQESCYKISQKKFIDSPEEDSSNITDSLMLLAQTLSIIFKKKAIIIIDEYDVPLEKSRGKYYQSMVGFIRDLFSTTFKTNDFLEKGFLTGCLRVSRESIFTGLNNIPVYDCAKTEYSELFGFTNKDVLQMLDYYGLSYKFDTIKEWYDGYEIGKSEIYNPYSVNTYVKELLSNKDAQPDCAWLNSSSNDFLLEFVNYLPNDETDEFKKLLDGQKISKKLNTSLNYGDLEKHQTADLWTMLYSTGYLTKVGSPSEEDDTFVLRIPNKEVKKCFKDKILAYFESSTEYKNYGLDLLKFLKSENTNKIQETLDDLLPKYLGLRDVGVDKEYVYHSFLDGIFACSGINAKSQQEAGNGYPDIYLLVENKDPEEYTAIILELKKALSEDENLMEEQCLVALKQCNDRKYYQKFTQNPTITKIIMYGIAFCNRKSLVRFDEYKF